MEDFLYIDSFSYPVTNLGPGKRFALWVQGCLLKCKGCMAISMQEKKESNKKSVTEIFSIIKEASDGLNGVTISGGEPFEQPKPLTILIKLIKEYTSLDIMVYSGYTIEELKTKDETRNLLNLIDILIDGRFDENNTNKKIWRGSDNQNFHILSKRAQKYAIYQDTEYKDKRELHLEMNNGNSFKIIGIPEREFFKELEIHCKNLGITLKNKEGGNQNL